MIACGRVVALRAGVVDAAMPPLPHGAAVCVEVRDGVRAGTVCASGPGSVTIRLRGSLAGITCGARVREELGVIHAPGVAGLGRCIEAETPFAFPALERAPVDRPLFIGVRAVDALLTIGRGARIGIFGSPGAGKSTLLETIVRGTEADAVVVALIGERGREAQEWRERLDARTSIVCATSDRPAAVRVTAAEAATAQAAALAARGLHVLLVLDSLARVAAALRELAIDEGERVGRAGYPPSVFAALARLCERAGSFRCGSVTMIATVLTDGDDRDPVSEAARSLLDGHIALSPDLARAGRYPAIDVPASASRTMHAVAGPAHAAAAQRVRAALALLAATAEARALGLDSPDPRVQAALAAEASLEGLLRQGREPVVGAASLEAVRQTADILGEPYGHH
jgi:FliI/YscN family ATPase